MDFLDLLPETKDCEITKHLDSISLILYNYARCAAPMQKLSFVTLVQACQYQQQLVEFCTEYYQITDPLTLFEAIAESGNLPLFTTHCRYHICYQGKLPQRVYKAAIKGRCLPLFQLLVAYDGSLHSERNLWDRCYYYAGANRSNEIVAWFAYLHLIGTEEAIVGAASVGDLDFMKQLFAAGIGITTAIFEQALIIGRLDIIKWYFEVGGEFPDNYMLNFPSGANSETFMCLLGELDHRDIIEWILHLPEEERPSQDSEWDIADLYQGAAYGGNLGLMVWLRANFPVLPFCDHSDAVAANSCWFEPCCQKGDIVMLEWLFEHYSPPKDQEEHVAQCPCCYLGAVRGNQIEILNYLNSIGVPFPPRANMADRTIENIGRHQHGHIILDDHNILRWAAEYDGSEALQWLIEHDWPYHPIIVEEAIDTGSLKCVQWFIKEQFLVDGERINAIENVVWHLWNRKRRLTNEHLSQILNLFPLESERLQVSDIVTLLVRKPTYQDLISGTLVYGDRRKKNYSFWSD